MKTDFAISVGLSRARTDELWLSAGLLLPRWRAFSDLHRHVSYALSKRRLTIYRLASAAVTSSRCRFFARPR